MWACALLRAAVAFGTLLLGMVLAPQCVFALNPTLDVNQYAHTAWKIRDGFSKGTIVAITQTPDGYLWLGTEFGLLRFDGLRYVPWQPPPGQQLPSGYVRSLLVARDGRLWIGTSEGLASWKDGKLTRYTALAGQSVFALLEDRQGTVWAGGHGAPTGGLCAINGSNVQCYGDDGIFGQYVDTLFEDRKGNLWVGAITGLWRWRPGPPKLYPMPERVQAMVEGDNGALIIATLSGIRQFVEGKPDEYRPLAPALRFTAREIFRDRDGGLWIGTTDQGLVHLHQGKRDTFEHPDGLSSDFVEMIFEDREGDIWVPTLDGLDRFHDLAVPTISVDQGLSNATVKSVLAATDGSVWLGTADGLNRWNNGAITVYRKRTPNATKGYVNPEPQLRPERESAMAGSLSVVTGTGLPDDSIESMFEDYRRRIWVSTPHGLAFFEKGRFTPVKSVPGEVHCIAGDRAGNIWVGQDQSLFHVREDSVVERIPWATLGHHDPARAMVADPSGGGLWIAFRDGGVAYFKADQIRSSYTTADGLAEGHIRDIQLDPEGTLWVSVENGLSRLKDDRFVTLSSQNGLPCDTVHWIKEDNDHSFWLYMACGLARISRSEMEAWVAGASSDPKRQVQATVFDSSDGVRSHTTSTGYSPSVAKSADGRLWFLPWDGVSVVDPRDLSFNKIPPPVQIEQIIADRKTYDAIPAGNKLLRLPPLIRDLEIDFTALSLVAPEKLLFRYKLEGLDRDWKEAGNRRQALYSNLPPGNYRFRVIACNNSSVWNEAGTSLDFAIAAAYYQTTWFRLSSLAALLALLAGLYRLRLRGIEQQFNARIEERVAERTRIAQELHDTLLQGFLSVSMQVHVANDSLPPESQAKPALTRALELMGQVIEEGRNALRGLRSHGTGFPDLEQAFSLVQQELVNDRKIGEQVAFRVITEGQKRHLHPLLRDQIYRIGREALINAFLHSRAKHIEIMLKYLPNQLCMLVRDDGCGIDSQILTSGRDGHWGLSGMQERADQIGARLHVWSSPTAGTEVDLSVPSHIAFLDQSKRRLNWFGVHNTPATKKKSAAAKASKH
jgi:signal transduction histidine kinase/ligand-binding sensor domain-containing protein